MNSGTISRLRAGALRRDAAAHEEPYSFGDQTRDSARMSARDFPVKTNAVRRALHTGEHVTDCIASRNRLLTATGSFFWLVVLSSILARRPAQSRRSRCSSLTLRHHVRPHTVHDYKQRKCQSDKRPHRAKTAELAGLRAPQERHLATGGVASWGGSTHHRKPHPAPDYRDPGPGYDRVLGMRTVRVLPSKRPRCDQREERPGPTLAGLAGAVTARGVLSVRQAAHLAACVRVLAETHMPA